MFELRCCNCGRVMSVDDHWRVTRELSNKTLYVQLCVPCWESMNADQIAECFRKVLNENEL